METESKISARLKKADEQKLVKGKMRHAGAMCTKGQPGQMEEKVWRATMGKHKQLGRA